jgi:hypothetical protein
MSDTKVNVMAVRTYFLLTALMLSTTVAAVPSMQLKMDVQERVLNQRQNEMKKRLRNTDSTKRHNERGRYLELKAEELSKQQMVPQQALLTQTKHK